MIFNLSIPILGKKHFIFNYDISTFNQAITNYSIISNVYIKGRFSPLLSQYPLLLIINK